MIHLRCMCCGKEVVLIRSAMFNSIILCSECANHAIKLLKENIEKEKNAK